MIETLRRRPGPAADERSRAGASQRRRARTGRTPMIAYAYLALPLAFYVLFMLLPWLQTVMLSFFNWDGIGARTWAGLTNYVDLLTNPQLRVAIVHSFELMIFFCVMPVLSALFLASLMTGPPVNDP